MGGGGGVRGRANYPCRPAGVIGLRMNTPFYPHDFSSHSQDTLHNAIKITKYSKM